MNRSRTQSFLCLEVAVFDQNIQWEDSKQKKDSNFPHRDYQKNLNFFSQWKRENQKKIPENLRTEVKDSHSIHKSLVMVMTKINGENYMNPINLHQDSNNFQQELNCAFSIYSNMLKKTKEQLGISSKTH